VVGDAGLLVAPGDPRAWAAAIAALAGDDARRASLRAAGHERVHGWAPASSAARRVDAWQRGASASEHRRPRERQRAGRPGVRGRRPREDGAA
jgi:hypothetical protein